MGLKARTHSLGQFSRWFQGLPGEYSSKSVCGKEEKKHHLISSSGASFPHPHWAKYHPAKWILTRSAPLLQLTNQSPNLGSEVKTEKRLWSTQGPSNVPLESTQIPGGSSMVLSAWATLIWQPRVLILGPWKQCALKGLVMIQKDGRDSSCRGQRKQKHRVRDKRALDCLSCYTITVAWVGGGRRWWPQPEWSPVLSTVDQSCGTLMVLKKCAELPIKNLPANARDIRDVGSVPGSWRSPGGGYGNPLQYSCLENPMDRGVSIHGGLQSMGSQRVGHDWSDWACTHAVFHCMCVPHLLDPFICW